MHLFQLKESFCLYSMGRMGKDKYSYHLLIYGDVYQNMKSQLTLGLTPNPTPISKPSITLLSIVLEQLITTDIGVTCLNILINLT